MPAQQKLENCDRSCIFLKAAMIFNVPVARYSGLKIPCSQLQRIFPVRNFNRSIIRSLTPQQAAGNALAISDQSKLSLASKVWVPVIPNIGPLQASSILNLDISSSKSAWAICFQGAEGLNLSVDFASGEKNLPDRSSGFIRRYLNSSPRSSISSSSS